MIDFFTSWCTQGIVALADEGHSRESAYSKLRFPAFLLKHSPHTTSIIGR
jgi:hypothetical protein